MTSIAIDRAHDGVVYATYGNFGGAHVFRSTDNGETWQASMDPARRACPTSRSTRSSSIRTIQRLYLGTDLA